MRVLKKYVLNKHVRLLTRLYGMPFALAYEFIIIQLSTSALLQLCQYSMEECAYERHSS